MSIEKNYRDIHLPSLFNGINDTTFLKIMAYLPIQDRIQTQRSCRGFAGFFQRHPTCIKDPTPVWTQKPQRAQKMLPKHRLLSFPNCHHFMTIDNNQMSFYNRNLKLEYKVDLPKGNNKQAQRYELLDHEHLAAFTTSTIAVFKLDQANWSLLHQGAYCLPYSANHFGIAYWIQNQKKIVHQLFASDENNTMILDLDSVEDITLLGQHDILITQQDPDPAAPSWAKHECKLLHYSLKTQQVRHVIDNINSVIVLDKNTCILNTTDDKVYRWLNHEQPEIISGITAQEIKLIDSNHLLCLSFDHDHRNGHKTAITVFSLAENREISVIKVNCENHLLAMQATANGSIIVHRASDIHTQYKDEPPCEIWTYPSKFELESGIKNAPTPTNL